MHLPGVLFTRSYYLHTKEIRNIPTISRPITCSVRKVVSQSKFKEQMFMPLGRTKFLKNEPVKLFSFLDFVNGERNYVMAPIVKHCVHNFLCPQSPCWQKIDCCADQGCARLMNQRQHDSSYRPLAMDSSPQLPSGTNYTTSTIVPCSNRTHYRQNRTTAYQRHSRSWQAASRAPSSPLWRC